MARKDRGVNPASGCVPILLTFPLIFVLRAALHRDHCAARLSRMDSRSLRARSVLTSRRFMGASQLWQQWMMPAAASIPPSRR
jgi:membrane protein insertase Oxa1/YidC/SpoIIIJ